MALTSLNKLQRQRVEVIQNRCLRYAKRVVDSNCISNIELCSRSNIMSEKHRVLALAYSWWRKASKNNDIPASKYERKNTFDQR